MASTRDQPLFNCFRAHVLASTKCLQPPSSSRSWKMLNVSIPVGHSGSPTQTVSLRLSDIAADIGENALISKKTRYRNIVILKPMSWTISCFFGHDI